jgi:hypothetical protein
MKASIWRTVAAAVLALVPSEPVRDMPGGLEGRSRNPCLQSREWYLRQPEQHWLRLIE